MRIFGNHLVPAEARLRGWWSPREGQKVDALVIPPVWAGWRMAEARRLHDFAMVLPRAEDQVRLLMAEARHLHDLGMILPRAEDQIRDRLSRVPFYRNGPNDDAELITKKEIINRRQEAICMNFEYRQADV